MMSSKHSGQAMTSSVVAVECVMRQKRCLQWDACGIIQGNYGRIYDMSRGNDGIVHGMSTVDHGMIVLKPSQVRFVTSSKYMVPEFTNSI